MRHLHWIVLNEAVGHPLRQYIEVEDLEAFGSLVKKLEIKSSNRICCILGLDLQYMLVEGCQTSVVFDLGVAMLLSERH